MIHVHDVHVGDRIQFMDYLTLLKKHKRDADRSKALWTGTTPVLNLRYHRNMGEFCFHVSIVAVISTQTTFIVIYFQLCCPCCIATTEWRITGQGLRWRRNRAAVNCCGDGKCSYSLLFHDINIYQQCKHNSLITGFSRILKYVKSLDVSVALTDMNCLFMLMTKTVLGK